MCQAKPTFNAAQHSVHPTGGSRRVFRQFAWLEAGSVKAAFSRPAHQRVTHTVGLLKVFDLAKTFLISSLIVLLVACSPQATVPIATHTPTLTVVPTESLTPTFTETSVPAITKAPSPTTKPPDLVLDSPNGEFIAKFDNAYGHPAYESQVIEILDKNGSLLWEIPYQLETAMVDPHPGLTIYGWSKDSAYLYFYYDSVLMAAIERFGGMDLIYNE
jgi:hypothetical protein